MAPTPSPAPTATTPRPTPSVTPTVTTSATPFAAPAPVVPHDRGSQPHASGPAKKIHGGYRYTVAKNDTAISIGYRFGVCTADVNHANSDAYINVGVQLTIRRVTEEPIDGPDCNL